MKILVLNAGSSSQKSCLYQLPETGLPEHPPSSLWSATIDWTVADGCGVLKVKAAGQKLEIKLESEDRLEAIKLMLDTLVTGETQVLKELAEIDIVGHRVVHGGSEYSQAVLITTPVKEAIASLIPLAPTHNPAHLEGIKAIEQILGDIPQVAVFDTAFHTNIPPKAAVYPIPYHWYEQGIRRYGFHGISHKYCAARVAQLLGKPLESLKIITCHLGNGASLAAISGGVGINTTMGFTPLEGLMMGTRSGSIDPAILIYLMREWGFDAEQLNRLLNQESGFKGVSGVSADLRAVLSAVEEGNPRAILAFEMYIHRLKTNIGAMLASLGGLDALVFTAGIGENAAIVREKACEGWDFLGLKLDLEQNNQRPEDMDISTPDSKVRILVIHTEEDWAIAQEAWYVSHQ
ncbi:acetate kinase [Gloeocapsa sp. PCC 73106]|uniref:acetate kinase n=1 Tax=Gloeocapsa sp. PCC 73106 TaxID=102232 RepID=UPI0002AC3CA0|nr:acetate kinase [Gloeocapsa sp. PCC 73106]ELR98997.1 acetate kinase [Gloeocapsa sp. PCC 73106]